MENLNKKLKNKLKNLVKRFNNLSVPINLFLLCISKRETIYLDGSFISKN